VDDDFLRSRSLYAVPRPSVVCVYTFVRPTQPLEIFRNVSTPFGTLAIHWHSWQNFTEIVPGESSVGEGC